MVIWCAERGKRQRPKIRDRGPKSEPQIQWNWAPFTKKLPSEKRGQKLTHVNFPGGFGRRKRWSQKQANFDQSLVYVLFPVSCIHFQTFSTCGRRRICITKIHANLVFRMCISFLKCFRTSGTPTTKILVHPGMPPCLACPLMASNFANWYLVLISLRSRFWSWPFSGHLWAGSFLSRFTGVHLVL